MTIELKKIRDEIDVIDQKICKLLHQRLELALRTAAQKKRVQDKTREEEIFDRLEKMSGSYKRLRPEFIKKLFILILAESRKLQQENQTVKD